MALVDLATLDGLSMAVRTKSTFSAEPPDFGEWDGTFCSRCGDSRRMKLYGLVWPDRWAEGEIQVGWDEIRRPPAADAPLPALFGAECLQCKSLIALVVYNGPTGVELVALPDTYGGLATPNTPQGVSYYLDQAQRCVAIGALSASVTMYRSALEHLLHEQGYTEGMLAAQINALIEDEDPPEWKDRLSEDHLTVIKNLGNGAIHRNDGNIDLQKVFEAGLLREVRELFIELLDEAYELPKKKDDRLARLKKAAESISR